MIKNFDFDSFYWGIIAGAMLLTLILLIFI